MFDRFITIAAATGAILQAGVAIVYFGGLTMIVLMSFSIVAVPY